MNKRKQLSGYRHIIRAINRFRKKDRSVLGSALLYATFHSACLIVAVSLTASVGLIKIKFSSLFYFALKMFFTLFVLCIIYTGIIKIYIKFFKRFDFKQ